MNKLIAEFTRGVVLISLLLLASGFLACAFFSPDARAKSLRDVIITGLASPLNKIGVAGRVKPAFEGNAAEIKAIEDFKWIFEAGGFSLPPAVNDENGSVYVTATTFDLKPKPDEQIGRGQNRETLNIKTTLYSMQPDPIKKTGKTNWVFGRVPGVVLFPPAILPDGSIVVEAVDDINNPSKNIKAKLISVSPNGKDKWRKALTFEGETFLSPPVVDENGSILIVTANINDFTNIDLANLNTSVSFVDQTNGSIKWSFNPAVLEDLETFIIASAPVIDPINNIAVAAAVNIADLSLVEKINLFIEGFEKGAVIDEGKNQELLDAIKAGRDINPIIREIENGIKEPLNTGIDEFVEGLISNLCKTIALDMNNGSVVWQTNLPGYCLISPFINGTGDNVLISSRINFNVDVDVDVNVDVKIIDPKNPGGNLSIDFRIVRPAEDDIIVKPSGALTAINILTGEVLWSTDINGAVLTSPVFDVENNRVIAAGTENIVVNADINQFNMDKALGRLFAIDVNSGNEAWTSEAFPGVIGTPAIDSRMRFPLLQGKDGSLFFTLFSFALPVNGSSILTSSINAVNTDGAVKWQSPFATGAALNTAPVISFDDSLFFNVNSGLSQLKMRLFLKENGANSGAQSLFFKGRLIGLNPETGLINKSVETGGISFSPPALNRERNVLYEVTNDFKIGRKPFSIDLTTFVHALKLD